jgi:hypothetical protein
MASLFFLPDIVFGRGSSIGYMAPFVELLCDCHNYHQIIISTEA